MRWILLCCLIGAQSVQAAEPSNAVIYSCLLDRPTSPTVTLNELPTNEILSQDDYRAGYNATYYFKANGKEIGYAKNGTQFGIIYAGHIYPANTAKNLLNTKTPPRDFEPSLADWSTITDTTGQYLCASFNFEGLGRSGNFQAVRGGYLLSISAKKGTQKLFFAVANTGGYPGK
jgi:hypothetical protein